MGRVALLIEVKSYQPGLNLRAAEQGVEDLYRVLLQSHVNFEMVEWLRDRPLQDTQETIETFFQQRQPEDQVLVLFAGYAMQESNGSLYWIMPNTMMDRLGNLKKTTALSASFVQETMDHCPAKQQVVILDCNFLQHPHSGESPIEQLPVIQNAAIALQDQIGGNGRVILTAHTTPHPGNLWEPLEVWGYTHYLAEGISTGAADISNKGNLSAQDLHTYVQDKLRIAAPAIEPGLLGSLETAHIPLILTPSPTPALNYRRMLEQSLAGLEADATESQLLTGRRLREDIQRIFGVPLHEADNVENEVLRPVREYRERLKYYQQQFSQLAPPKGNIDEQVRQKLKQLQQALFLTDRNTAAIDVAPQIAQQQEQRERDMENLMQYEQLLLAVARRQFPFSEHDRQNLRYVQQALGLSDEDALAAEGRILSQIQQMGGATGTPNAMNGAQGGSFFGRGTETTVPPAPSANAPTMPPADFPTASPAAASSPNKERITEQMEKIALNRPGSAAPEPIPAKPAPGSPPGNPAKDMGMAPPSGVANSAPNVAAPVSNEPDPLPVSLPPKNARLQPYLALILPAALVAAVVGTAIAFLTSGSWLFKPGPPSAGNVAMAQQLLQQGMAKVQNQEYKAAISDYSQAIKLNPQDPNVYAKRANAYHLNGDLVPALKDYTKVIELDPNSAEAYSNRSHVRYDQKNYKEALDDANWAVTRNPNLAAAYINLANARFRLASKPEEFNVAIRDYDRAINLKPEKNALAGAYTNRGNIRLILKDPTAAMQDYTQALRVNASYADAFYNKGLASRELGDLELAKKSFQQAAELYQRQGYPKLQQDALERANGVQKERTNTQLPPSNS